MTDDEGLLIEEAPRPRRPRHTPRSGRAVTLYIKAAKATNPKRKARYYLLLDDLLKALSPGETSAYYAGIAAWRREE